jgi:hypothetical protein
MFKVNYQGLRRKTSYDDILHYIQEDQPILKYPDRRATFMLNSPYMTQFIGDTHFETEDIENNEMVAKIKEQL